MTITGNVFVGLYFPIPSDAIAVSIFFIAIINTGGIAVIVEISTRSAHFINVCLRQFSRHIIRYRRFQISFPRAASDAGFFDPLIFSLAKGAVFFPALESFAGITELRRAFFDMTDERPLEPTGPI